uniref:Uncharacterized protein n=1 Tax=Helianthus annuus TaxID=4232 RepID=A0A251VCC5_HELAN
MMNLINCFSFFFLLHFKPFYKHKINKELDDCFVFQLEACSYPFFDDLREGSQTQPYQMAIPFHPYSILHHKK